MLLEGFNTDVSQVVKTSALRRFRMKKTKQPLRKKLERKAPPRRLLLLARDRFRGGCGRLLRNSSLHNGFLRRLLFVAFLGVAALLEAL